MTKTKQPVPQMYFDLIEANEKLVFGDYAKIGYKIQLSAQTISNVLKNGIHSNKWAQLILDNANELINNRNGK